MLQDKVKEKEEISALIKDLNERRRKNKEISVSLYSRTGNKDVFDEHVKLDNFCPRKRSRGIFRKAWGKVQGFWAGK